MYAPRTTIRCFKAYRRGMRIGDSELVLRFWKNESSLYVLFLSFKLFNLAFKAYKPIALKKIGLVDTSMDSNLERRPVLIADCWLKFALCTRSKIFWVYSYREMLGLALIKIRTIFGVYAVHFLTFTAHYYSTITFYLCTA